MKVIKKTITDDGITIEEMQNLLDITEEDLFNTKELATQLEIKNQLLDKELISILKHKDGIANKYSYLKDFIEKRIRSLLEDVKSHLLSNSFFYTICKETDNNSLAYMGKLENRIKIIKPDLKNKAEDLTKDKIININKIDENMKILEKLRPENENLIERINQILNEEINHDNSQLTIDIPLVENKITDELLNVKIDNTKKSDIISKLKIKIDDLEKHIEVLLSQDVTKENEAFRNNLKKMLKIQKELEEKEKENVTYQFHQKV